MSTLQPWSTSKIDVARSCTLRFHLKYLKKVPGEAVERSDGRIGSAVHLVLEKMLKGEDYRTAFTHAALYSKITYKETLELKEFETAILRFMSKFEDLKTKTKVVDVHTEQQFAITRDLQACDYWDKDAWLRGVIDVAVHVERQGVPYLLVIDHKSGEIKDISNYKMQLFSYIVMGMAHFPEMGGIQPAIHWLKAEEVLQQKPVEWMAMTLADTIQTTVVPELRAHVEAAEVAAAETPKPSVGWYCEFCEYRKMCPAL
jgi:CRISPR/Cas system-associated exonuclease Cas4 (RecB family)